MSDTPATGAAGESDSSPIEEELASASESPAVIGEDPSQDSIDSASEDQANDTGVDGEPAEPADAPGSDEATVETQVAATNDAGQDEDEPAGPAFVSWGHEQAPVVLALHDVSYDLRMWYPLGERLAESYRLIAVDLPGHGTEPPAGVSWTVEEAAESAREMLAEIGVEIAAVVGCGLGARIAAELAIQQPGMVAALVLADPSAGHDPDDHRVLALRGPRDLGKRLANEISDGFLAGGLRRRYETLSRDGLLEAVDAHTSAAPLDEQLIGQVQCPTLVCASAATAATEARRLVRDLPSGRLVLFRDSGPVVAHARPEDFADQVYRFLRAVEEGEQVRGERTI